MTETTNTHTAHERRLASVLHSLAAPERRDNLTAAELELNGVVINRHRRLHDGATGFAVELNLDGGRQQRVAFLEDERDALALAVWLQDVAANVTNATKLSLERELHDRGGK